MKLYAVVLGCLVFTSGSPAPAALLTDILAESYSTNSCELLWHLPFYFVNLDRSPKRREHMTRLFPRATRIRGVDGMDPSDVMSAIDFPEPPDISWSHTKFAHYTKRLFGATPGELGCYASRLDALKQMYADGHEIALIGEDDVDLSMCSFWTSDLARIIRQVHQEDPDWHLLRLQWSDKYAHMQAIRDLHLEAIDSYLEALIEATVVRALSITEADDTILTEARLELAMDRAQQDVNVNGWVDSQPVDSRSTTSRKPNNSASGNNQIRKIVKERWLQRYNSTTGDWVLPATGRYAHGYGTVIALWSRKGAKATIDALSSATSGRTRASDPTTFDDSHYSDGTGRYDGSDLDGDPGNNSTSTRGRWRCTQTCVADYHFEEVNAPHSYVPLPPLLQVALLPPEQGTGIRSPGKTYIAALAEWTGLGRVSSDLQIYAKHTRFTQEWFHLIRDRVCRKLTRSHKAGWHEQHLRGRHLGTPSR